MTKCKYCENQSIMFMICNDNGNIPLCNEDNCFIKFEEEFKEQQYFIHYS